MVLGQTVGELLFHRESDTIGVGGQSPRFAAPTSVTTTQAYLYTSEEKKLRAVYSLTFEA